MSDMTFTPKQAVFKAQGSLAALVKPEVWETLLSGAPVGVIEPDPRRWSLLINGRFYKTVRADTETVLKSKCEKEINRFNLVPGWPIVCTDGVKTWDEWQVADAGTKAVSVEILPGYYAPMILTDEKRKAYIEAGMTPDKCASEVRGFAKRAFGRLDSYMGVFNFMDAVATGGLSREGRD